MEYITYKRFKGKTVSGDVNIPALTRLSAENGVIYLNGQPICAVHSNVGFTNFAANHDGNGMHRGRLIAAIQTRLHRKNQETQESWQARWDKVWDDAICRKYQDLGNPDFWVWNDDFYTADIQDLQYIARLIGVKEVKK